MKISSILIFSFLLVVNGSMFCSYFPLDPIACVTKTEGIRCEFNQFENACMETKSTSHGCVTTLNEQACLSQLTTPNGTEARCSFGKKCVNARSSYLKGLGCSVKFSKYSCTNVVNKDCFWDGKQCSEYKGEIPQSESCESVFGNPVTTSLCSQIKGVKCLNTGFSGDYQCATIEEAALSTLTCDSKGLNYDGCISIITPGQACIFEKKQCQNAKPSYPKQCSLLLNRLACLSITNPSVQCEWKNNQCKIFSLATQLCNEITDVNPTVCSHFHSACQYDTVNQKCITPSLTVKLNCTTQGLTKDGCLQIKNYYCTYINGICEELKETDLSLYQCGMQLNEDACTSITTEFQYCKWNGSQCSRMTINQDVDCPVDLDNDSTTFNGNVCEAISKPNVACKYNTKTHRCVQSEGTDDCNVPYMNLFGCISVKRAGSSCQWTKNGCGSINVVQYKTTCDSLGFANYISCSQVFEDMTKGCYYNSELSQCQSINIVSSAALLNTLQCSDVTVGLNKVACASITTDGQICRWYQNQCVQIKRKVDVAQIECLRMQFVNQYACALVEYNKETCRYEPSQKGCVNSVKKGMACKDPGLNTYSCAMSSGSCYFDTTLNQCKEIVIPSGTTSTTSSVGLLLNSMQCQASSPTIDVCKQIITVGQLCAWSTRATRCVDQIVVLNQSCATYTGSGVSVNANVCAAIEMDFPDYNLKVNKNTDVDRGYCKFNPTSGNCDINGDTCSTPCCTEKIGINAHSCSRFTTQADYVYCYFGNNLRCQQLTSDQVDIYNADAVKSYYNSNQMRCSQMNRNSCHMLEWSTKQLCYHNGNACVNLNYSNYPNLAIFIQSPNKLNKYACLAIEASITSKNTLKYFEYDSTNMRCKLKANEDQYTKCSDVVGNRNICLSYTNTILCKWNTYLLQCVDLTADEFEEVYVCSYNQNKKACIENPNAACQFSNINDRCIDAPTNVPCNYFNSNGPVSPAVCARITMDQQMCEFNVSNNTCINSNKSSNACDVTGANSITCYYRTSGNCRWDPSSYVCYENQDDISTLGCEDNLNGVLCLKVTKEPCVWDLAKYKCIKFTLTNYTNIVSTNSYNQLACYTVTGGAFYFLNSKCLAMPKSNSNCQEYYMNEYACLFYTQGYNCYYDPNESAVKYRCKPFTGDQTVCTSNVKISLEVCMQIPSPCLFNVNTLQCVDVTIAETQTCTGLHSQTSQGLYYNRISCASVSEFLDSTDSAAYKCLGGVDGVQTCNYEKYCYWNSSLKTCDNAKFLESFEFHPAYNVVTTCASEDDPGPCHKSYAAYCSGSVATIPTCNNAYSKALCLEIVSQQCYFDINQGGCNSFSGNEHKLSDCAAIVNPCTGSYTAGVVCQLIPAAATIMPGDKCSSIQQPIKKCMNNGDVPATYKCADITDKSPVVCAHALDQCRFNGSACTSSAPSGVSSGNGGTVTYTCDRSMSQAMCENYGCDFTFLGYCQQTKMPPPNNGTNKYHLCYEVNILKTDNKAAVCASVDQACKYTNKCEDATNAACTSVTGSMVSSKACLFCTGGVAMQYDLVNYKCIALSTTMVDKCEYLNQQACLLNTQTVACQWITNQCVQVDQNKSTTVTTDDITTADTDCTLFNSVGCPYVNNNCWVDTTTKYCSLLDPTRANCSILTTQSNCIQSNQQACQWVTSTATPPVSTCSTPPDLTTYTCESANKFGCLHMAKLLCGWSEVNQQCYPVLIKANIADCNNFVDITGTDNKLAKFNDLTCSALNINTPCFRDQYFKCRTTVSKDILTCDTPGINQYACVNRTVDQCQFIPKTDTTLAQCVSTTATNLGCSENLNISACINQKTKVDPSTKAEVQVICQFKNNVCQDYAITVLADIINTDKTPYSISACSYLDATITDSIVYSIQKKRCVSATLRDPFIADCTQLGVNKYACLNKTTGFCKYADSQCQTITKNVINATKTCDSTFNWQSCISLQLKCKFVNNSCVAALDADTCQILNDSKALVGPLVCQTRIDVSCRQNTVTNRCEVLTSVNPQSCSQAGLNQKGCIANTKGSMCLFSLLTNTCIDDFSNVLCTDLVNEDKCLSIRTKGQYCKFTDADCVAITTPLTTCPLLSTPSDNTSVFNSNPVACSQSTDFPCFYDIAKKQCIKYTQPDDNSNMGLYDWPNSISFNKLACQQYNENSKAVYWMDNQCVEIPSIQLGFLTCADQDKVVNRLGCIAITNATQTCKYDMNTHTCTTVTDLTPYISMNCADIININSPAFCEVVAGDKQCTYDASIHACKEITETPTDCENKGYNQSACVANTKCQFNKHCYTKPTDGSLLFCSEAASDLEKCLTVGKEGCTSQCQSITNEQYSTLTCDLAINSYGCTRITTSGQYCQFANNICSQVLPQILTSTKCSSITNANSYEFCEQPIDTACSYNSDTSSCVAVYSGTQYNCQRGLNQLACLNFTTSTLQCQFFNYCYGPNAGLLNCDPTKQPSCCSAATTKEACLFQTKYQCQWGNNICSAFTGSISDCNSLSNVSRTACTSVTQSICVFDLTLFKCKSIQPTSCDQVQSAEQCRQIENVPCLWNETVAICQYKVNKNYDECQDIKAGYGNKLACMGVERPGQMCKFDTECVTFSEDKAGNNCLNNINKVACTLQVSNTCYWQSSIIKIKTTQWSKESDLTVGQCHELKQFDSNGCKDGLSYLSCLKISQLGAQCQWLDEQCQQIPYTINDKFSLTSFVLVNSNACGLINNEDMVRYQDTTSSCIKITDISTITCSPLIAGLNKQACLKIQSQKCQWKEATKVCVFAGKRLLVEEHLQPFRLLASTCKSDGTGPKLCAQITLQMACGAVDNGCDYIDNQTAQCPDSGLNKYACVSLTTGPCAWTEDDDGSGLYHCDEYYPYTSCASIQQNVNSIVCSYAEDDACVYNSSTKSCEVPTVTYNSCEIPGINAIACARIPGCIFLDQQCKLQDVNINVLCAQAAQANSSVCQLAIDRCKYSNLTNGCITSTITDNCSTEGLSALGCNVLDACQWSNNSCQCIAYLNKYPDCNAITTYNQCINADYCFFEVASSNASKDITQYMKNTNYGTCRVKACADIDISKCNGTVIDTNICYLTAAQKCKLATKCEDIVNATEDCMQYSINNKQCRTNLNSTSCQTLNCSVLDQTQCAAFQKQCIYSGYCKIRSCESMGKDQCLQNNCDWNSIAEKCQIQLNCSQVSSGDACVAKKQNGAQCAWLATSANVTECTPTGCRYLGKTQGDCMGTQIGSDVCVQMVDFSCVSCEEITDSCVCLNKSDYCTYDRINKKCKSLSCQSHNESDCTTTHCYFSINKKTCLPKCQYNYNQIQCNQADECLWDSINSICISFKEQIVVEQIILPSPNYGIILQFLMILIITL